MSTADATERERALRAVRSSLRKPPPALHRLTAPKRHLLGDIGYLLQEDFGRRFGHCDSFALFLREISGVSASAWEEENFDSSTAVFFYTNLLKRRSGTREFDVTKWKELLTQGDEDPSAERGPVRVLRFLEDLDFGFRSKLGYASPTCDRARRLQARFCGSDCRFRIDDFVAYVEPLARLRYWIHAVAHAAWRKPFYDAFEEARRHAQWKPGASGFLQMRADFDARQRGDARAGAAEDLDEWRVPSVLALASRGGAALVRFTSREFGEVDESMCREWIANHRTVRIAAEAILEKTKKEEKMLKRMIRAMLVERRLRGGAVALPINSVILLAQLVEAFTLLQPHRVPESCNSEARAEAVERIIDEEEARRVRHE